MVVVVLVMLVTGAEASLSGGSASSRGVAAYDVHLQRCFSHHLYLPLHSARVVLDTLAHQLQPTMLQCMLRAFVDSTPWRTLLCLLPGFLLPLPVHFF